MKISSGTQVGEVVKMNFRTASFFQSHHIDFCCGDNQSIEETCNKAGINTDDSVKQFDVCKIYKITINQLKEFEKDLYCLFYLENNISFTEAVAFEQEFVQ